MDQQLQFDVHQHCIQPVVLPPVNYSDATQVSVTRMKPSTGWSLASIFIETKPLPYLGNGISPFHSTETVQLSSQPNIILLSDCCSVSLFHINGGVQSYRHTAIPHCMAVVLWTHLHSTLCKSTVLWKHPCSTLRRSTVSWTHPCSTLCTAVLWKHPCSMFRTVEEPRLTNGTMLHTMKENNLMDKHQVPYYIAVKSYWQTPSENCIPVYKKCTAWACCVPVMGVHHQEFGRITLLENLLSTPASLVEI